jgi:membrane fusion protein
MSDLLFREEIFEAKASQSLGNILLMRPVPMHLAAWISVALTVALCVFLSTAEYTAKVRVSGQIMPVGGAVKAVAPQFGRVLVCHVREGMQVAAGQLLYELSSERNSGNHNVDALISAGLIEKQRLLHQEQLLATEQLRRRAEALSGRHKLINAGIVRLEEEISLQRQRADSAGKLLARYRSLRADGYVSEMQVMQYESEQGEQLARLQALERSKLDSLRDRGQTDSELEQVRSQIEIGNLQSRRNHAQLDQEAVEQSARSRFQVLAPTSGIVTTLNTVVGESVIAGSALATILPKGGELQGHLLAPSRSVGFVTPGQLVRLRVSAFPYQKFGDVRGTVVYVEQSPISSANSPANTEPIYKIIVRLERQSISAFGKYHQFLTGMTLEADIRQERRKLVSWLFDPVLSAAKEHTR